jgi:acyl transferase domain-containing protein
MTKVEADAMDPQQRLLLEVAYESIENGSFLVSVD